MIISTFQDSLFQGKTCTYDEYQQMVENGMVQSAVISQNKQTPTGKVRLNLNDGTTVVVVVPDVIAEKQYLDGYNLMTRFEDVPQENYFMTCIVPTLLVLVGCFLLFSIMSGRANGGNGGNAMLNFGKSRARLMIPSGKKVTFKDVAGLEEEKE